MLDKKRCLVTNFDKNYYRYAAVMLKTLADNYREHLDVICIVSEDLMEGDYLEVLREKLSDAPHLNIQFRSTNGSQISKAKPWEELFWGDISSIAIDKIFISSICREYSEAVYVDADCIFTKDAWKFIEHPLPGSSKIVAMPEQSFMAQMDLNAEERAYFNNGVFVTDLDYWRENDLENKMIEWLLTEDVGICAEQTAMNVALYDVWFPMSPNFNYWDSSSSTTFKAAYPSPTVVHFVGALKPWNDEQGSDEFQRGPHDKLWKYIYNQLWDINTLYQQE